LISASIGWPAACGTEAMALAFVSSANEGLVAIIKDILESSTNLLSFDSICNIYIRLAKTIVRFLTLNSCPFKLAANPLTTQEKFSATGERIAVFKVARLI
jgi:hypothetical protein